LENLTARRATRINQPTSDVPDGCAGCWVPILGLIFLAIGIYLLKDILNFLPGTVTTQGTIIHCSYKSGGRMMKHVCKPTIQFITQAGQSITVGSFESSSSYYEGMVVQVRYHPNTPHDGRIYSFMDSWIAPLVFTAIGLIMLFSIPFMILRGIRKGLFLFGLLNRFMQR
jgi:hypothetical protein